MRDLLIRYLLGELDADEQQKLQSQLRASPELRQELVELRACYEAHRNDDLDAVPPSGLASRVAERVTNCDDASDLPPTGDRSGFSAGGDPPQGILGWSLADLTVAGGVVLAVSMLIFPALRNSRNESRRELCGLKLHDIYLATVALADNHANYFPKIGPRDHAGAFVIQLVAKGYADRKDMAYWLVCPDSPLAEKIRTTEGLVFKLPSAEAIKAMSTSELDQLAATASPCFAYRLPHRIGHELKYVRNDHNRFTPVLSDTPGKLAANSMTPNHGGGVAQIHFADGSVRSFTCWKQPFDDDLSRNKLGLVAAGIGSDDVVLGGSDAIPGEDPAADGE